MKESLQLPKQENPAKQNNLEHEIFKLESMDVELTSKRFESSESDPEKGVIFLPGIQMPSDSEVVRGLAQAYMDSSKTNTYAVQTKLWENRDTQNLPDDTDFLYQEATAIAQFIEKKGLKKVTITGYSAGGMKAIDLTSILQEHADIVVEGLILLASPGLYEQEPGALKANLIKDSLKTPLQTVREKDNKLQSLGRGLSGLAHFVKVLFGNDAIKRDFGEMDKFNSRVTELRTPIVIVNGSRDQIIEASKIVPNEVSPEDREAYLKENIFLNSPYVRMVVPEKHGRHGLPIFRPESVANATIGLLDRHRR